MDPSKIEYNQAMDRLTFRPGHRNRSRCDYDDYYVNGKRLAEILNIADFIPPFGWLESNLESEFANMLLLQAPSNLRTGRIPLFVCPECVDYGCGVGTCNVQLSAGIVTWSHFGWESSYQEDLHQEAIDKSLVLRFDETLYKALFASKTNLHYRR